MIAFLRNCVSSASAGRHVALGWITNIWDISVISASRGMRMLVSCDLLVDPRPSLLGQSYSLHKHNIGLCDVMTSVTLGQLPAIV